MKTILKLTYLAAMISVSQVQAQTIFTYGKNAVNKDEFLRAFNKNPQQVTDRKKALQEYLDLYIKFKLKVQAAKDMRLDTLPNVQFDATNFRQQVAESYTLNEKIVDALTDEAVQRGRLVRSVVHYFVPEATADKQQLITRLEAMLSNGEDVEKSVLAQKIKINTVPNISAFSLPYVYENLIFNTPVGAVSKAYSAKNGTHIFKILSEAPNPGKWKVAQILFAYDKTNAAAKSAAASLADSVYQFLKTQKMSFEDAVHQYSNDRGTEGNHGELAEFAAGTYSPDFESQVFAIKNDEEIKAPFATDFGYHIVKRIKVTPIDASPDYAFETRQRVMKDARLHPERERFAAEAVKKTGIKISPAITDAEVYRYADSALRSARRIDSFAINKKTVAVVGKKQISGRDWVRYVFSLPAEVSDKTDKKEFWNKFLESNAINYYKDHLENYSPEFKAQYEEFMQGSLLFEAMEREVWGKANDNAAALTALYNAKKEKYTWGKSGDVVIFNGSDAAATAAVYNAIKGGKSWKEAVSEGKGNVQADSARYELAQLTFVPDAPAAPAAHSLSPLVSTPEGNNTFIYYLKLYPVGDQRSFADSRGMLVNDYQVQLEEEWINRLRKKYAVKVNEAEFRKL